ncbi:MAG: sigma-54 dependent transcriptional regulator [Bacteroidota bacterium]
MLFRVLLADDDPDYTTLFARKVRSAVEAVGGAEAQVEAYPSGEALLAAVDAGVDPALIFLDVSMPGLDGLEVLRRLKLARPALPVVMVSAQTTIRVALDAIELGAHDYLTKAQDDLVKAPVLVQQVADRRRAAARMEALRRRVTLPPDGPQLIGASEAMVEVYRTIEKATRGDLAVTILGESGTGKELVAEAIHHNSARASAPFVVVNSAAIPRELMESEFFGHEKGSFTGALTRRRGVFELADGGTLFLDEIGDLAPDLQAKLLRVLQDGTLRRVGGYQTLRVDVRVIAATHRNLEQMVKDGAFREDLFYRLCQFPVLLPPLRDREADILLLAEHFLRAFAEQHPEVTGRTFSPATRRTLLTYRWSGNVRELKSTVERAALLTDLPIIEPPDLMLQDEPVQVAAAVPKPDPAAEHAVQRATATVPTEPRPSAATLLRDGDTKDDLPTLEEVQRAAFLHAHDVCQGVVEDIAQVLDVSRSSVYRMLKRYDLMGGRTWGGPRPNSGPRRRDED